MKILLISDTHGDLVKVRKVFEKLNKIDLILHCGDYERDGRTIEDILGVKTISVKGNCDSGDEPDRKIVETPGGNILITHGHLDGAGYDYNKLIYLAEENQCVATCFGHTHVAMVEDFDGIQLINPGSLSKPRDGSNGTYVIIHSTDEEFYANIVHYDMVCGQLEKEKKKPVKGGRLRDMLNYSDRF